MERVKLNLIIDLLSKSKLAVISTHAKSSLQSESALVAFAEDPKLRLYFQTGKYTRKYANLQTNNHVSFVIGWSLNEYITLQYEGVAREVTAQTEVEEIKQLFVKKDSPTTSYYLDRPESVLFTVEPTWLRYSGYSKDIPTVWEYDF